MSTELSGYLEETHNYALSINSPIFMVPLRPMDGTPNSSESSLAFSPLSNSDFLNDVFKFQHDHRK